MLSTWLRLGKDYDLDLIQNTTCTKNYNVLITLTKVLLLLKPNHMHNSRCKPQPCTFNT